MEKEDEVQQGGRGVYTFWCVRWAAQGREKIELGGVSNVILKNVNLEQE